MLIGGLDVQPEAGNREPSQPNSFMWNCSVCGESVEDDTWKECWKCGSPRTGSSREVERQRAELGERLKRARTLKCARCETPLRFFGTKRFHEGSRQYGFWLGDLGELFVNREAFDVYACPLCGKVEMFVDGLGEAYRPPEGNG